MVWLGMVLIVIGFVLVVPRGALAGSAAVRNVAMPPHQLVRTPGYQAAPAGRVRLVRLLVGALCLLGGFVVIFVA
jgi:hypothetical protein